MATKKRKRRKRKNGRTSHYITGVYEAKKCKEPVKYRSSWELIVAKHLDNDPNVLYFEYETMVIPYITNERTNRIRKYFPDFIVKYVDGKTLIIEVKRSSALNQRTIIKKAEAAKKYISNIPNCEYVFWTEKHVMPLKKIQTEEDKENSKKNV